MLPAKSCGRACGEAVSRLRLADDGGDASTPRPKGGRSVELGWWSASLFKSRAAGLYLSNVELSSLALTQMCWVRPSDRGTG